MRQLNMRHHVIERSSSVFEHIFSDKRHQFSLDNLEKTLIVYCNLN